MKKVVIYGKGEYYKQHKDKLPSNIEIVAYADSFMGAATSATGKLYEGKPVFLPSELREVEFDIVYICTDYNAGNRIFQTLINNNIPSNKILFLNRIVFPDTWEYVATEDKKGVISTIAGIRIKEQNLTDFDIVEEVFVGNAYHMEVPFSNYIVIDMGMNIGAASLYFARKPEVCRVYGFEPFSDTYEQALENFARNEKHIRDKIVPFNTALLNVDETMQVAVPFEQTGWRNIFSRDKEKMQVEIECRDAGKVVQNILDENLDKKVILKCDVEGSEFKIFASLDKWLCFEKIDAILMEVHGNPLPLEEILKKYNYKYFVLGKTDRAQMLYAVK